MEKQHFYQNARHDIDGPLHGVRVIEVTTTWAGPMAGCILADYGADVIKVEAPTGEVGRRLLPLVPGTSLGIPHETVNRNKRNLTIDLHEPEGQQLLKQLVETADVFLENFRPGALAEWGLGYPDLCQVNSGLIYVSVSGFGQFGELHARAGYDPIAQNYSGWSSLNGDPDDGPTKAPTFLGDDLAGLHAALGTMAALRHRDRTGEGQHVDVALIDCLLFQSNGNPTAGAMDVELPRMGNQFSLAAPVNAYNCTNGKVFAGVLLDSHWKLLAKELKREDLAPLGLMDRLARRDLVDGLLAGYCAERTVEEVVDRATALGLPATRINTYADVARQQHVHSRDMLQAIELSNGQTVPLTGPAAKFSRTPVRIRHRAPMLGEHTAQILADLGCKPETIADLKARGVI
jgi:crotonobetainyl-CoA:carnitine CoA-transferase CaiB-like acyl-CoA transferase